jgi:single-strand DNA-binding protein
MQIITITGSLGRDSELKRTKTGDEVLSFPVGVTQGYGDGKTTNWYRCSLWGKRAVTLQQYLLKGVKVTVSGSLKTGEYEGKTQLNIDVTEVEFMSRAENAPKPMSQHNIAQGNGYQPDDLDDDLPPF